MDKKFYEENLKKTLNVTKEDVKRSKVGMTCTDEFAKTMDKD